STPTNTGAMADHRFPVRCGEMQGIARALAARLGLPVTAAKLPIAQDLFDAVFEDLQTHRGKSLVIAGESQPPYVHALVNAINAELGNLGETVFFTDPVKIGPNRDSLPELVSEMKAGKVSTLVVLGANPVYTAPVDLQFAQHLRNVKLLI